jgi:phosphoribosylformylglycinamidine synthase
MPHRIEITLKDDLPDAEGDVIRRKAMNYFGIDVKDIRTIQILTFDTALGVKQIELVRNQIFTNPITQISSLDPLDLDFDWIIWVGYRPGVKDNPGSTAVEAVEDLLKIRFSEGENIYTSKRYCLSGQELTHQNMKVIAGELLANDIIQQWKIFDQNQWDLKKGIGFILPKVKLDHKPTTSVIGIKSNASLKVISDKRNLALNINDIPIIRSYFIKEEIKSQRAQVGLSEPTDVELEYISQARSDHCNHNTFQGLFHYSDLCTGEKEEINSLFHTYIKTPTLRLKQKKDWVVSVLWDNAGVGRFDDNHHYVITGETHNSPSNMEAYGGAITGIVGIYRDPMGTGKGSKLIMGSYGFCVGPRNYNGPLKPHLHPRRLLDGVIEGVRDGGNKSGIPTPFGQVLFHPGYLGKCLVFVTALGIMPEMINGEPAEQKMILPGDLVIMSGGRVGKDGIHGVTASSETFSESTPLGHVQIGDPYTQKKMHDFLLEARDEGLIRFITDNGGGGLSSSVGETARFSNGCKVQLEKVPLKYDGLDQWEIWISESQERMTLAVSPDNLDRFMALSSKHAVESTVIGTYTDTGKLHLTYSGKTCAYVDLDLLTAGFPQWEFDAQWRSPEQRGFFEPVFSVPDNVENVLLDLLARPNICSKEWIIRQYDHEVQGSSAIKPLVGKNQDVNSDACVIRPILNSKRALVFSQALIPMYSAIDAYHMTTCTIDEAIRRLIAAGGNPGHLGGVDNFCWPHIQYHPDQNPDGKFKAAQLVRSCKALKEMCLAYEIPLLSGKDSMYVDGHLSGSYGEMQKVSALETLQFSATSVIKNVEKCVTLDCKVPGDLIYVLGTTKNELGASEYYELFGYLGLNVPKVKAKTFFPLYEALALAIDQELIASAHGIYRGGLGVHLAMKAMAGGLGMSINLHKVPMVEPMRDDQILFSESAGRFIVTVDPMKQNSFEALFSSLPYACVGKVTSNDKLVVCNGSSKKLISVLISDLKHHWKKSFGSLI